MARKEKRLLMGVLKEAKARGTRGRSETPVEQRRRGTLATVLELMNLGYDVVVQPGAGTGSSFADEHRQGRSRYWSAHVDVA